MHHLIKSKKMLDFYSGCKPHTIMGNSRLYQDNCLTLYVKPCKNENTWLQKKMLYRWFWTEPCLQGAEDFTFNIISAKKKNFRTFSVQVSIVKQRYAQPTITNAKHYWSKWRKVRVRIHNIQVQFSKLISSDKKYCHARPWKFLSFSANI